MADEQGGSVAMNDQDSGVQATGGAPLERFGEALIGKGKLTRADLARAQRLAQQSEDRLPEILVKVGMVSEREVAETLAQVYDLPLVKLDDFPSERVLHDGVSARFLREQRVAPLGIEESGLSVAVSDPGDDYIFDALRMATGHEIVASVGVPSEIEAAVEQQYGSGRSAMGQLSETFGGDEEVSEEDIEHLKDLASEAPVIRVVNLIMQRAVESRASDIHIEPFEDRLNVRLRIDGVLHEIEAPPARSTAAVISRVKIMARLNIAERRLPQDGRIQLRMQGKELDLRVSTVPTLYGESVVMRLLDKESVVLDFEQLGFVGDSLERFLKVLHMPHGIILVTGPTGSGKTTNLYTALNRLNTAERKIITVEDPVEYQLAGINQIQVKAQIGLTFASALRSIVRQDPDVIMIGEMRDLETARIAVQSALTGHLVLSTVHTNTAAGGVTRLLDMGVEDYLLTSTVNGIVGQRLVRTLCPHCKEKYTALPEMVEQLQLRRFVPDGPVQLYHPVGCDACGGTGYQGRTAILEVLIMSDPIRRLVMQHASSGDIQELAMEEGMHTMYEDGLQKAVAGVTSVEEVLHATEAT